MVGENCTIRRFIISVPQNVVW